MVNKSPKKATSGSSASSTTTNAPIVTDLHIDEDHHHINTKNLKDFSKTRILVVGAGGIGCELLKNLVMSGFLDINVIDLDTIDLSNLNRQFLFQHQHVGMPKALVAKETVEKFNPLAKVTAHHASIFDVVYEDDNEEGDSAEKKQGGERKVKSGGIEWFKSFDLVLNALDNLAARRYVNKMCLAANIPLVESGTAGYLGQVSIHKKNELACFDCTPKEKERKTYPVCTIRSTPSEPIHCIVWAKSFLFQNLVGKREEGEENEGAISNKVTSDNAEEISTLKKEADALSLLTALLLHQGKGDIKEASQRIFEKVFSSDVERILGMEDLWTSRRKPVPIDLGGTEGLKKAKTSLKGVDKDSLEFDQKVWSLEENIAIFMDSLEILAKECVEKKKELGDNVGLEFDKDHFASLDFVTATSNLRSTVYGIPLKSRFSVKEMAGNIIPAIATTNAIVAGMIVMLAIKICMGKKLEECKNTFVSYGGERNHFLASEKAPKPNPNCQVCSNSYITVKLDPKTTTLADLVEYLADPGTLPYLTGELSVTQGSRLLYDVEEVELAEKTFEELHLPDYCELLVTNDDDDYEDGSKNHSCVIFCLFRTNEKEKEGAHSKKKGKAKAEKAQLIFEGDLVNFPVRPTVQEPVIDTKVEPIAAPPSASSSKKRPLSPNRLSPYKKKVARFEVGLFQPIEIDE